MFSFNKKKENDRDSLLRAADALEKEQRQPSHTSIKIIGMGGKVSRFDLKTHCRTDVVIDINKNAVMITDNTKGNIYPGKLRRITKEKNNGRKN